MPGSGGGGGGLRGSNIEDPSETSTMEARLKDGFAAPLQTEARCSTQRAVNRACFMANERRLSKLFQSPILIDLSGSREAAHTRTHLVWGSVVHLQEHQASVLVVLRVQLGPSIAAS